jgi:hypothetical protein
VAKGDDEHKMLFDLRSGRRRNVVKVVYATLAVLMGLSLFLVIGGFNIAELFSGNETVNVSEEFEDDAERLEQRLVKDPENEQLLLSLTRARINAGNSLYEGDPGAQVRNITPEAVEQFRLASEAWEEYLDAAKKPSASGALLVAPTMITLAENSRNAQESLEKAELGTEAAGIVARQRPNLNSLATYAFYTALLAEKEKAEKIANEAKKETTEKAQREAIDKQVDEYLKIGNEFRQSLRQIEQTEAQAGAGAEGGAGGENPLSGSGLGGSTLGE